MYKCKLYQSDSESDPNQSTDIGIKNTAVVRAMRPTISSQNKIIMNKSNLLRRRSCNASQSTSTYICILTITFVHNICTITSMLYTIIVIINLQLL